MLLSKFDYSFTLPEIKVMMSNEDPSNDPEHGTHQTAQQTKMDGIVAPLVAINGRAVDRSQVKSLKLTQGRLPELSLTVFDSFGISQTLDNPDMDYTVQIQILPPADNMCKKINLLFRCSSIKVKDSNLKITGEYITTGEVKIQDSRMKAYGEITSYELFESIANEYQLGFVTNIDHTSDKRWIYNPNQTFTDFLSREITYSGIDANDADHPDKHVFNWWVDFYNNLVFVDMFSEYSEIVSSDDEYMMLWSADYQQSIASDEEVTPMKNVAAIHNYPSLIRSETYLRDPYRVFTDLPDSTDLNFETFNMNDKQRRSTIISDGDVQRNYANSYKYGGELFGEYDYLTKAACRSIFMSKIVGQGIEVILRHPILPFWQGRKVNFYWFDTNTPFSSDDIQDQSGGDLVSNIPLPTEMNIDNPDARYMLNKTISGQYMILSESIKYIGGQWTQTLKLGRYADQIQKHK